MLMGVNRVSTVIDSTSEGSHNKVFTGDVQVNAMVVIGHGLPSLTEKEAEKVSGLRHTQYLLKLV